MGQGSGNAGSRDSHASSRIGPALDYAIVWQALPISDDFHGAALNAAIRLSMAELEKAGEWALEPELGWFCVRPVRGANKLLLNHL